MAIGSITPNGTATPNTVTEATRTRVDEDYQNFLTLLTAQISNQDPLEPMDSSTFVTQLAQLTQVEQSVTTNANLESISAQLSNVAILADMQLIGREVTVPSETLTLAENGRAGFSYMLGSDAARVSAEIRAADGTVVRKLTDLPRDAGGLNRVEWDGVDSYGLPVPPADFSVKITALDHEDESVTATAYNSTTVERLTFEQGAALLHLGNGDVRGSDSVLAVE